MRDAEIIASFLARDEQAIKEVESKYGAFIRNLAKNILKKPEDAEEIANDALLAAWESIPPKTPKNLKTFLGRLVRDKALSRYRALNSQKRGAGSELLDELEDCIPAPEAVEETVEANELSAFINEWLEALPKEDSALFVRRYWYGETVGELSEKLGVSPKRLSQRLYELRKKLKVFLERKGITI
jgi:RNA polymerase sigma-70 factor (ECF subfamily)